MKDYFSTKRILSISVGIFMLFWLVGMYWSFSPATFSVKDKISEFTQTSNLESVTGIATTTAVIEVGNTLLNKPGGYLSNDMLPPSVMLDNMPAWEFGVLEMLRDITLSLRKDFSRSQSQSVENEFLVKAQPNLNINSTAWVLPSAESEYQKAFDLIEAYRTDLADVSKGNSQFYARADNLRDWLKEVEKRLGSMSQKLSASVGTEVINTNLAGYTAARQSTATPMLSENKTSWFKLDDNFYQARGMSWALIHFLKAVEIDFADVLEKKNALVSLRQIIRELEATQETIYSPMILNGSGFGLVANHSLVMANYISRANAALIELSELLNQG